MKIRVYAYYYELQNSKFRRKRIQSTMIADSVSAAVDILQFNYDNKLKIIATAILEE